MVRAANAWGKCCYFLQDSIHNILWCSIVLAWSATSLAAEQQIVDVCVACAEWKFRPADFNIFIAALVDLSCPFVTCYQKFTLEFNYLNTNCRSQMSQSTRVFQLITLNLACVHGSSPVYTCIYYSIIASKVQAKLFQIHFLLRTWVNHCFLVLICLHLYKLPVNIYKAVI